MTQPPPPPGQWLPPSAMPGGSPGGAAASWGARLGAYLLDLIIGATFSVPALIVLAVGPKTNRACSVDSMSLDDLGTGANNAICRGPSGATIALAVLVWLAGAIAYIVWRARMEGATGQTLGKKAVGIRTVDATTGQPIGTARAVGRYFAYIISAVICYVGFLWALWDPQKQAWHDKIVTTRVVRA